MRGGERMRVFETANLLEAVEDERVREDLEGCVQLVYCNAQECCCVKFKM